jgi:hypothetical protein
LAKSTQLWGWQLARSLLGACGNELTADHEDQFSRWRDRALCEAEIGDSVSFFPSNHGSRAALLAWILPVLPTAAALTTTYTDGQINSSTLSASDSITLSVASGAASQTGVISGTASVT